MHQVFEPLSVILRHKPSAPESYFSIRLPFGALVIFAMPGSVRCFEFLLGMIGTSPVRVSGDNRVTR